MDLEQGKNKKREQILISIWLTFRLIMLASIKIK
jgi:hypothetical protein